MPVDAITSFLIILAVALTTFATRVFPFLVFPRNSGCSEIFRKGADAGSDRDAGSLLSAFDKDPGCTLWTSGSGSCHSDGGASCLETE